MTKPGKAERADGDSPVFTPGNEPYLGRQALFHFDQLISALMAEQQRIGPWTRAHKLTPLQQAACELVPGTCSIVLSIRELIRQGYLLAALILIRPLVERVATLGYLIQHQEAVSLWRDGWPHGSRPPLSSRIQAIASAPTPGAPNLGDIKAVLDSYNSLVHGDPASALAGAIFLDDGGAGFTVSKDLRSPGRADQICYQALGYTVVLLANCSQIFPPGT